ncbi:MAG: Rieske 2Fe-2S domain-containing protein [Acidimicrobiia bacterium]|nr:Rieske 2Fe-2S domain-containing protein [Acidimicrobiia bacterium]
MRVPENERAYRAAVVSFAVAVVGGITAAFAYATDQTDLLLGLGLAVALGGIGFGLVSWAKHLGLDEHAVQQREPLTMTADDVQALEEELTLTRQTVGRRKLLVGLFGGSFLSLLVGFVGPIGSLGPKPRGERGRTSWRQGARLVTSGGTPVESGTGSFDQLVTVFPEGAIGVDDSQVILLRLPPDLLTDRTVAAGSVDGWVAYSKICTHAGCSVGLLGVDNREPETVRQLVCPCHQSVFDPLDGAAPVGGPAPRSLPQLPLAVDADGFLVAQGDFPGVVGPLAWDEA